MNLKDAAANLNQIAPTIPPREYRGDAGCLPGAPDSDSQQHLLSSCENLLS